MLRTGRSKENEEEEEDIEATFEQETFLKYTKDMPKEEIEDLKQMLRNTHQQRLEYKKQTKHMTLKERKEYNRQRKLEVKRLKAEIKKERDEEIKKKQEAFRLESIQKFPLASLQDLLCVYYNAHKLDFKGNDDDEEAAVVFSTEEVWKNYSRLILQESIFSICSKDNFVFCCQLLEGVEMTENICSMHFPTIRKYLCRQGRFQTDLKLRPRY
jgi:hypothetical protein